MKICMVGYTFYETDGRVIKYAEALRQRGDDVHIIALRKLNSTSSDKVNGVKIFRIQKRKIDEKGIISYAVRLLLFFLKSFFFLSLKYAKHRYDIIHIHSVPDFEVFAAFIPKIFGAKILLDIHDLVPELYSSKFNTNRKLFFKILLLIEKLSINFSDHVIISNHIWKNKLISRSVNDKKCTVILNFPDNKLFTKTKKELKNEYFKILYPGTLNWHQGLDLAIKAFAIIKNELPNAKFFIYGEGASKYYLSKLVKQLNLEQQVFLYDYLPIQFIAKEMQSSDLGLIPKRNDSFGGEAFSTKILEFMSTGVPVIVSKTRIDQFYFDDELVKFFEPENVSDLANAILFMYRNREHRKRLAHNSYLYAKKNSWKNKRKIYFNLIDSVIYH